MLSWQVGAVKITRIVELEIPVASGPGNPLFEEATPQSLRAISWLYPNFVNDQDQMLLSIHALLVEAPGVRLVVDTCIGNDRPAGITGLDSLLTTPSWPMEEAGWSRESVDAVLCTHLHVDHVGWNTMLVDGAWVPTFPKARYLIGRTEFDHWRAEGDEEGTRSSSRTASSRCSTPASSNWSRLDHRISPEVRLTPTPGHTPGHVSVVIRSKGEGARDHRRHDPPSLPAGASRLVAAVRQRPEAAATTRARLFAEWADKPILVIGTHYAAPTAGHVRARRGGVPVRGLAGRVFTGKSDP